MIFIQEMFYMNMCYNLKFSERRKNPSPPGDLMADNLQILHFIFFLVVYDFNSTMYVYLN